MTETESIKTKCKTRDVKRFDLRRRLASLSRRLLLLLYILLYIRRQEVSGVFICSSVHGCRSMLPDVVDDFSVTNPSCRDLEPLFFSCYAFCSKLSGGLSVGVSTVTLQCVTLTSARSARDDEDDDDDVCLIQLSPPLQVGGLQSGSVSPWRRGGDSARCSVRSGSCRALAGSDGLFLLLSNRRAASPGTTDLSPVTDSIHQLLLTCPL